MSFNPKIDDNQDKKIIQQQLTIGLSNINFSSAYIELKISANPIIKFLFCLFISAK